jgi:hypothetical protein
MYMSLMRRPLVIYDFATATFWIALYIRQILFSFFISVGLQGCCAGPPFLGDVVFVEGEWEADRLQHLWDELHVPRQLQQGDIVRHLRNTDC